MNEDTEKKYLVTGFGEDDFPLLKKLAERKVDIPDSGNLDNAFKKNDIKNNDQDSREKENIQLEDFYAYAPENKYIYIPTRDFWPSSSVDLRFDKVEADSSRKNGKKKRIRATEWLSLNRSVEQATWAPGRPMLIENRILSNGGWLRAQGSSTFNLYQPPRIKGGDPERADLWLELIYKIYPKYAEHLISWFAHRVQRPDQKVNHALILGGPQGIGKDSLLEPVRHAVGPWNVEGVSPIQLLGRFNGFIKSVILRVDEARDLGDVDRYKLYEHLKNYTASPPLVLRCDEKNRREYNVLNLCGVVITTNYKTSGLYLPSDDRRHFVAWSETTKNDFSESYWKNLWKWYYDGGFENIATFLRQYDISEFDPKAPPQKTDAFWEIVDANRAPEDAELADALDKLDKPDAVTIEMVAEVARSDFYDWLNDRRNRRQIPHRFETAGYVRVRNDAAEDGLWKIKSKRVAVYAKKELPKRERISAAQNIYPTF